MTSRRVAKVSQAVREVVSTAILFELKDPRVKNVTVIDQGGNLLTRWGGNGFPRTPEEFYAPHDVFVDSAGSIYTAEVKAAAAKFVGDDTSRLPSLRKFVRCGRVAS